MPLLNPSNLNIHAVLKESGIKKNNPTSKSELKELLESNSLSAEDCIVEVGSLMRNAENENVKLSALKVGLELNGLLKNESGVQMPTVIINIQDSEYAQVNPILFPREIS